MNAPENCGSANIGLCRGRIRAAGQTVPRGGRFQRAPPAGPGCAGAACGPPLPLRKPCLYIQYKPYNSFKFILFSTDLPPSAIRRASIFCQKSASIGPSSCKRPLAHSSTGFVPGQGTGAQPPPAPPEAPAVPAGVAALRAARAAPRPFFGFYTARTLSPNYTDIRQNPPAVLRSQMPCAISPVSKLRRTIQ